MSNPRVSFLLPVYNSGTTLKQTLDSLLTQTFTDFELLVVDDGSTDDTSEILDSCSDPRLRVLTNPQRLRLAGALNRGIQQALAPLIARMDADDLSRPGRLSRQLGFMDEHPEIVMCGTWTRPFGDKNKKQERYPLAADDIKAFTLFNCPFSHPSVMFRKEVFLKENLVYDGSFYPTEDYELWTRVVHRFPCANLPEVLLDYRVHAQSMTGADWENMDVQACRLLHNQFSLLGVTLSEEDSRLHRDIGMARVQANDADRAAGHLESLLTKNLKDSFCPEPAFTREVQERWFHVCMNMKGDSSNRLKLYMDKRIWPNGKPPLSRRALLKASMLREKRL